jgi:hypothetical protein
LRTGRALVPVAERQVEIEQYYYDDKADTSPVPADQGVVVPPVSTGPGGNRDACIALTTS